MAADRPGGEAAFPPRPGRAVCPQLTDASAGSGRAGAGLSSCIASGGGLRGPVRRRPAALPRPDRAGTGQAAAPAAHTRPRQTGIEALRPGQAPDRPAEGPGEGPAPGLGREGVHRHRAAVRPDPGRGPDDQEHDPVRDRDPGEPGPQRPAESWAEPGHPGLRVGIAGAPAGGEGPGPGGEDQTALHEPAVLGVRAGGPGLASEPSRVPVHRQKRTVRRGQSSRAGRRLSECAPRTAGPHATARRLARTAGSAAGRTGP
jgi:hypothetical protein